MSPEQTQVVAVVASPVLVGLLVWSLRRNIQSVDDLVKGIDQKVDRVETDVRQLSAQGARHGEALAGGVAKFASIEKRLDKAEERMERFQADCIACRTDRARG